MGYACATMRRTHSSARRSRRLPRAVGVCLAAAVCLLVVNWSGIAAAQTPTNALVLRLVRTEPVPQTMTPATCLRGELFVVDEKSRISGRGAERKLTDTLELP